MEQDGEEQAWVALSHAGLHMGLVGPLLEPELGLQSGREASPAQVGARVSALVAECRGGGAVSGSGPIGGSGRAGVARALSRVDPRAVERTTRWLEKAGVMLVTWASARYPRALRSIPDPPCALYVLGDAGALGSVQVAVVGSRNPTPGGRNTATRLGAGLARAGLAVTSGLARGIDAAAHRGALAGGGISLCVLGSGLPTIYPREHRPLAEALVAGGGAVVSELPPGTPPRPWHFPHRNRIISGLACAVVVVEAARRSGSLITARLAAEQGREVMAVPGAVDNPVVAGCHDLLRQGAGLVTDVEDVLCALPPWVREEMSALPGRRGPPLPASLHGSGGEAPAPTDGPAGEVLAAVDFAPTALDTVIGRVGLTADRVSSILTHLELEGHVEASPGGCYVRLR